MGGRSNQFVCTGCGIIAVALLLLWAVGPFFLNAAWVPWTSATNSYSVLLIDGRVELTFHGSTNAEIMSTEWRRGRERLSIGIDDIFDNTRPVYDANGRPSRAAVVWFPHARQWSLLPGSSSSWSGRTVYRLPYWCLAVPLAFVAVMLERRRRLQEQRNKCRRCGYDRAGLAKDAICPECGRI